MFGMLKYANVFSTKGWVEPEVAMISIAPVSCKQVVTSSLVVP